MQTSASPTDQRAGARPISFLLDSGGSLGEPVALKIRPEDLTRTEPSRSTVHQTLGRGTQGWVDNFGEGLPSVNIAGHTGWRATGVSAEDGVKAFEKLNQLIVHDYAKAKQDAIDQGKDPAAVKLIFIDTLDGFTWSVVPTTFVLRRSKSRPLLMQYNITMQAISTSVDDPTKVSPMFGDFGAGLGALGRALAGIAAFAGKIVGMVSAAVSFVNRGLSFVGAIVGKFTSVANSVLKSVNSVVGAVRNGASSVANRAIGIAADLASVGVNVFRTLSAIRDLPSSIRNDLSRVASAYNEVVCIFRNSLRPRKTYDSYEGLYGASNCSSTTGGRMPSSLGGQNIMSMLARSPDPVSLNTMAQTSVQVVKRSDPVLAPMQITEMARHLDVISSGVSVEGG